MAETTFTVKIAVQQDGSISLIDQAGQKIASLGQAASAATGGLGTLADGTQAVGTAAQSAGSQMGDAGNKAGELGSKAASSSGGISSMASTLLSLDAAVRLANAAFDLGKAAFDAFFMSIVDRAGSLDDLSQKIGVAGSTLSQFSLAAQATGTSVEGLGTGFKFLSVNINEAANGSSESAAAMRGAFQTLGVDVTAALSDTNGALLTLADTFATMPDGAEKTALAMQLFGRAGVEIIPFLNMGSEGIARMTELNDKLGLSFSGETLSALDNFGDQLTILGNVGTGVFTQLVTGAAPALSQMADALVDMAAKAGINSGTLQEWGRTIATTVVNAVASALGAIGQFLVDIESAGIGTAIYNAFAAGLSAVGALASSAMASVKASIYDALSVLPLIGSSYADAAEKMRASSASYLASISAIGQGSAAIGNAGQVLIDTSDRLRGVAASASEAGGAMSSAADGSDQMSTGMATVATGANLGHEALKLLTSSGTAAGPAVKGAGDAAGAAGVAAGGAAGGVDKLSQAMEKLASQSTEIATKQGIYDAYISGAINYETALIALDTAQIGGKEATENLTVAIEAEKVAREQGAAALTQQTAELMNKNAETSAEVAALAAAAAAGQTYESAQLGITAAVIQYQAEQKLAAGYTAEQVAAWAEAQMQVANLAASVKSYTQALKDNSEAASLEKQIATWEQVRTGVMSVSAAQRQLAIDAKVAGGSTVEAATKLVDLAEKAKTGAEAAQNAYVNMGDIIEGAFSQSFDAVISGTRDLGDALEGIGLSIGKQMFSAMLKSKMNFDDKVQANFLGLGEFGSQTFSEMFSKAADFGAKVLGSLSFNVESPSGGGGNSTTNPSSPDFIGPPAPPGKSGGGGLMSDFMAGIGYGQMGKMIGQTFFGEAKSGSEGVDRAISGLTMVTSGLANTIPIIGPLLSALTGLIGSQLPRLFAFMVGVTTKGTKQRREGETELDKSPTFSALQKKDKLGDYTRGDSETRGLEDNYRTGVATAVERGMAEGEANALKGAGEGIFSVIFKGDGDKMVNGAMDMGRGMAEFLSRGLADGMTYDEMLGSLRSFAKENDITFEDALNGVTKFGAGAMEQFGKIGHADWGAQEFADGIYGISEIFKGDFPAGVNLASIALQTMEKDGSKAFANLDAGTKAWILSVSNDAEAFKTVFADLAIKGFTIDTVEFKNTLADITASAEFVGKNIGTLLSAPTLAQGMQGLGDSLKSEIAAALGDNMLGDLFDTTGIATAFQDLFSNIRQLKDGSMGSGDFMSGMAEAIATGKANLEQYLPQIQAMREAMAQVKAAVDEAFKPTAAEQLAAAVESMASGLKDSFGTGIAAAMEAGLAEGGSRSAGIQAFADSMRGSIKDSIKESIVQGLVEAAMMKGPLAEMMATFGQAFQGALSGGISTEEQAMLDAYLGQIGQVADATISYLEPSVNAVLALGEAADKSIGKMGGKTVGVPEDPRAKQTKIEDKTISDAFASNAGTALSSVLSGGDVASAVSSFSAGFKTSIGQSVMEGLQSALIQAATTEGALGGMMASFKEQTAAAMADGVLTGQEKADLSSMAAQIKDTAASTASALEPIVGAVAEVGASLVDSTAQASAQLAEMQGKVQSAFSGAVGAAFSAIGEGKSVADAQAAFAESFKKSIASSVAEGLQEALVNSAVMEGALGGLMSQFKDATAAAMSDGVITASEQANLAAMAGQIKTAGDAAAAALAPVVGAVAAITAGTTSAAGDVSFTVASQAQGYATAADTVIGTAATGASTTVATASTSAATTVSTALQGAGQAMATGTTSSGAAYAGTVGAAATSASGAIAGASTEAGATISGAIAMTGAVLAGSATELTGATQGAVGAAALAATEAQSLSEELRQASSDSAATTTAGYADAAQLASDALGRAGQALSGDVAAASESLKVALTSVLGTGDTISALAPDAAYGIGQSLADVRDKVAPEMQTQIDALIGSLSDASLTPEESAKLQAMVGSLGSLGSSLTPEMASQTTAMLEAVGSMGGALDPEAAAKTKEALGSLSLLGGSVDPGAMAAVGGALAGLGAIGTSIDPEAAARTADALSSIAVIGTAVDPAAMDALGGALAGIGTIGTSLSPELAAQTAAALGSVGALGESLDPATVAALGGALTGIGTIGTSLSPELAAQTAAALGSVGALGESIDPAMMEALGGALSGLGGIGTSLPPELAAQVAATLGSVGSLGSDIDPAMMEATRSALSSVAVIGTDIDPAMMEATRSALAGVGAIGDSITAESAAKTAAALGSLSAIGTTVDPTAMAAVSVAMTGLGAIGTALPPELAAQVSTALGSVGALGESIDPAMMEATQSALSSLATIGSDIDPAMMDAVGGVLSGLSDAAAGMPDPAAVVQTMKALGDAALSSGQASDLAGTMRALGSAALDAGQAADMSATLQAFAASSSEGASNTTAVIEAFGGIDAGMSGSIKSSLESLVSSGVAEGATALSESLGGDGPAAIVSGLSTLQSQLDSGTLSSLTTPLNDALSSVVSPADELQSALQSLYDPTRNVTSGMSDLGSAVASAVGAINGAIAGLATAGGVPAAATGGQFASGSAVVGEAGKPELVTASQGGGFSVTPLSWDQAHSLMGAGTAGFASGGRVGMGRGGADLPVAPPGTGGGGGNNPGPRYTPNAEGAEFADFTSAITDAFRAGLEGSKGFIEDFSDTINESVRTKLVDAIMQGFSEGPAIQKYADAIDVLITKAQTLAGNGELTAASLGDIQAQIKENTDAIGEQADQLDEILEPLRQASAISTAFSEGLDFSGALKSLAADPSDLEAFGKSIDQTVNDAVLNGAIQGLLASGPIQDAVKKFGDSMNDAMATALEDGVITAEESDALHDMAVSGSAEMKTAMEALGPVLSALGIDLGDAMTEGINRATEVMKSASSAMDPFAALGEGETQFTNFTQNIKDQVYSNIKDGLVQAFIDSAVTNGLLAGPMMAIQAIFDQIGQKQLTTAEANAALAEQTAAINGSLNDPAFKSAFDTTMASISSIGQGLGQTSQRVESAASTAANSAQAVTDASKDVCSGKCELEKQTMQLGNAAVNTFGRAASVSIEQMLPKLALGGLVTKKTTAVIGEAGPELVIPTKELAAAASAIQRVDFGSARESATAGMASLMAAMPTSLADSLSGAMTDQQDAMAEKIKQAASAGGGTARSISDALASAMDSLTGGGDIGAIADSLSGAMTDQNTALAEKIKQGMGAGGDVAASISDALVGAMGSITEAPADSEQAAAIAEKMKATMADAGGSMTDLQSLLAKMSGSLGAILPGAAVSDEAAAQAEKMKATMAGTGGSLTDIADTLSGLSTSLTATATTTNAAMAQRLAEVASATVEKPVVPTPAVDIERVVAGTMSTVDAIKDLEDRLDKLSDAILAQPTEVIVQMDRETLMRAMAKADRFKKKARYGVQA